MRYPTWLKKPIPKAQNNIKIREIMGDNNIHTVCESALCPNRGECFEKGTVTFMIMGDRCTRSCTFCAVKQLEKGTGNLLDPSEPKKIAQISEKLKLKHVVITSVTRDDLPDGGASHFAKTILAVKLKLPNATIEVLTPDYTGADLVTVLEAGPDIFNHNIETIARLYPDVRPQADFEKSLAVLKNARIAGSKATRRRIAFEPLIKSGFMLGLGETEQEIKELLQKLKESDVDIVTLGQYLAPSKNHYPVKKFVHPDKFAEYKNYGEKELGIRYVFAGPFVRSSYLAGEVLAEIKLLK